VKILRHVIPILLILMLLLLSGPMPDETYSKTYNVDLVLGGEGANGWTVSDVKPGMSGTWSVNLHNAGDELGTVYIWISDITSCEGSNPESEIGNTAEPGELTPYILFNLSSSLLSTNLSLPLTITYFPQSTADTTYLKIVRLNPGETAKIDWQWAFIETGSPQNEAQGDCLSFSINYTLEVSGFINSNARTIGFWQNKNGQTIIRNYSGGTSGTSLYNYLTSYNPFKDLMSTTGSGIATYVYNIIKSANSSKASMNAMLKAQMLATALNVYFSDPGLGGNRIDAPAPIGGLNIDLTSIYKMGSGTYENASDAFGGATSLSVSELLNYAASQSNPGGSLWYGNVKATQELAKDTFDAINNQCAFAP